MREPSVAYATSSDNMNAAPALGQLLALFPEKPDWFKCAEKKDVSHGGDTHGDEMTV
jgi:hypothetical protein